MLSDGKAIDQHLMLIDLERKNTWRVLEVGWAKITEKMVIEWYFNVTHIVSNITGELKAGLTTMDALRAIMPPGTLSGAPKICAVEIIDELESVKLGVYGAAVAYFAWNGNMGTAIAISIAMIKDGKLHVHGRILADSPHGRNPEQAPRHVMFRAVALAAQTPQG